MMPGIDWAKALTPTVNLGELFLRGSVVYLFLYAAFRVLRRQAGAIGISDLLAIVLIADAAQNAMAGEYVSVPEGLVLVSTILFWDWALNWLSFRFPALGRIIQAPAIPLVVEGRYHLHNMKRQLLSQEDLLAQLRLHGLADIGGVRLCTLEGDGHITVLKSGPDGGSDDGGGRDRAVG
ncbi:MAG: YetF domain-containing protein [Gemmatimonadota bacterium]